MKKKFKIALLLSFTFLLGACSQSENHDKIGIGKKLAMGEHWFSQKQVKEGKKIYIANCESCHNYKGIGSFNWRQPRADGSYPPPPLNGTGHSWHHRYPQLLGQIANGGGIMPAFKNTLTKAQRVSALAYVQSLWSDEIYQRWEMGAKHAM